MLTLHYRLGYRSDIEGLRAVAILLVVAAHAKVRWLAGGFVGVDVFFVLSGYLITGLLVQELSTTGKIRFANFYARRFRRLLPALLAMLVGTCVAAVVLLPPAEQPGQATAGASAAIWLSNFHFAFSNLDYFGPDAEKNLFLHTWSLGVEEQFYLVWPTLLVLLGAWHAPAADASIHRLKIVMLAIAGISLLSCVLSTDSSPQLAFYLMPSRAWQFALGALTLLYFQASPGRGDAPTNEAASVRATSAGLHWCGWSGLVAILAAALLLDANTLYPGLPALLPSLGTAAVLAAGSSTTQAGVGRALSWRPLQAIGRVSYAWYLWHWPVLLLGGVLISLTNPVHRLGLVVVSLALAVLSYRFVEAPIRRNARLVKRPGILVSASLALMVIANVACITWFNAVLNWINEPRQQRTLAAHSDMPVIYTMGCDDFFRSADVRICAFGPQDSTHVAVMMGDSIGGQWFPAMKKAFDKPGWRLLVLTKSSCPMVDEPLFNRRIGRSYVECSTWRENALKQLAALKPDIVLFGSAATYEFNRTQWIEGTSRVLDVVSHVSGHIYLLRATPGLPFDGPACLSARNWLPALALHRDDCHARVSDQQNGEVYQWLQQAAGRFRNVTTLDMNDRICPDGKCDAEREGRVVYRDEQHLTAGFAESLGDELRTRMDVKY
jgi:peptidoglycan/LPS O-acetylase OafA/YrhL